MKWILETMYPGAVNSPETFITSDISASDKTITVQNANDFPIELPYLLVIGGALSNAETVLVTDVVGNTLTIKRGYQGVAQEWPQGSTIACNFTEAHYSALVDNINLLDENKEPAFAKNTAFNRSFGTTNPTAPGTAAPGSSNDVSRDDHVHPMPTPANVGAASRPRLYVDNSTARAGWLIETDISPVAAFVYCEVKGQIERSNRNIDTEISFTFAATGVVTNMGLLNKGIRFPTFVTFINANNRLCIYLPNPGIRLGGLYVRVYSAATSAGLRPVNSDQLNDRVLAISSPAAHPVNTSSNWVRCPVGNIRNTDISASRTVTVFIATEDGDDLEHGSSRARSNRTLAQALKNAGELVNQLTITVNRSVITPPAAYASGTIYAVGDLCTRDGYVWRSLIANNQGNTPGISSIQWAFNNNPNTAATMTMGLVSRGNFSNTGVYAVGDVVNATAGARAITYVCTRAVSSNQNVHSRPSGTLDTNAYWTPISSGNAVMPATSIAGCTRLILVQTEEIFVIYLTTLTVSNNAEVHIAQRVNVGNVLRADHVNLLRIMRVSSALQLRCEYSNRINIMTTLRQNAGAMQFVGVNWFDLWGTVTITTHNPTISALDINGSKGIIHGAFNIRGNNRGDNATPAANTGNGIQVRGGGHLEIGRENDTLTVSGMGGHAIFCDSGGNVVYRSRSLVINRDAPADAGMAAQPAIGGCFRIARSCKLELHRNLATITRNGATDRIDANGTVLDWRRPEVWALHGIRA